MNIGKQAETLVSDRLRREGFHILAENWRCRMGEIDIIAQKDNLTHFIEVKALRVPNRDGLRPEEHFTRRKFRKLKNLANYYALFYNLQTEYEIDLAAVCVSENVSVTMYHNVS